jgi:hypothetical protein
MCSVDKEFMVIIYVSTTLESIFQTEDCYGIDKILIDTLNDYDVI